MATVHGPGEQLDRAIASFRQQGMNALADGLAERQDWRTLAILRDLAHWRGQLFARDMLDQRLVRGPVDLAARAFAGRVLDVREGHGGVLAGAAAHHSYARLAPRIADPTLRLRFAHERVVRGEDLRTQPELFPDRAPVPLSLEPWEPQQRALRPPALSGPEREVRPVATPVILEPDDDVSVALSVFVRSWPRWCSDVRIVTCAGGVDDAIAALGADAYAADLTFEHAVEWLMRISADGSAHGGGEGFVAARVQLWNLLTRLAGIDRRARPVPWNDVERRARACRWARFTLDAERYEWLMDESIAVSDPGRGRAWALVARSTD